MKLTPGQVLLLVLALTLVALGLLRGDPRLVEVGVEVGGQIEPAPAIAAPDTDPGIVPDTDPAPDTDSDVVEL